jgi:uncharacterized lipoprotein
MKFLLPAIAVILLAGCNSNMATHRRDFSPSKGKGPWTDYHKAVARGEQPEAPKELKDR